MQTSNIKINGETYTLTALSTGKVRSLTKDLEEAEGEESIFEVSAKYIMISLRVEHTKLNDDFLDENTQIFEIQEIFQELMDISSLKKSETSGKQKK